MQIHVSIHEIMHDIRQRASWRFVWVRSCALGDEDDDELSLASPTSW